MVKTVQDMLLTKNDAVNMFVHNSLKKVHSYEGRIQKQKSIIETLTARLKRSTSQGGASSQSANSGRVGSGLGREGQLTVPTHEQKHKNRGIGHRKSSTSIVSGSSGGSSGGDSGSGTSVRRRRRRQENKKNQKDNILTRIRDAIAESDVFVSKNKTPPHQTCIYMTIIGIPIFFIILLWDTLAVTTFEIPHLSMIDYPGFVLSFQFIAILLAMYGYCVQVVTFGDDSISSLGKISLACHYPLFLWRVFLEIYYDGFRNQEKSYLPRVE